MGYSPLGTVESLHSKKKKSEFSLYLSILWSSLLAQISSSLQEMANVATSKSGLHPSSPKASSGKVCLFLSNLMIGRLQLCPNIQPRMNSSHRIVMVMFTRTK